MADHDLSQPELSSTPPPESIDYGEHDSGIAEAVHFDELVTELVTVAPERVDQAIQNVMGCVLDLLELDHGAVFLLTDAGQDLRLAHHWTRAGAPDPPSEGLARTEYPWMLSRILEGRMAYVRSLDDVPNETDRESLRRCGATSLVAFPLIIDGAVAGAVSFASKQPLGSTPGSLERLSLVAHMFGSALGRKRVDAVLQSSELRFRAIADQAPVMIWISGPDKRTTWFNRQWLEFVGHSLEEEVGTNWMASVHPDDLGSCLATYEPSFEARRPFTMEYRLRRCDGAWRWILDNGAPNFAGGEFAGYLGTCVDITEQKEALQEVVRLRDELHLENVTLKREVMERRGFDTIVGESEAIRSVLAQVERVAATDATVLLLGETGTGKELFATRIHELSARRARTMVRVNCAAIPPTLIESELFGRERGAFTGALARQVGRFELADHSTIFLDEIGDLPLDVQVKLLRVLEERQIERLGSPRADSGRHAHHRRHPPRPGAAKSPRARSARICSTGSTCSRSTCRRCASASKTSRCSSGGSWWTFSKALGKRIDTIPQQNMQALLQYPWPGNVRELRNVVERSMILANGPRLTIDVPTATPARAAVTQRQAHRRREGTYPQRPRKHRRGASGARAGRRSSSGCRRRRWRRASPSWDCVRPKR